MYISLVSFPSSKMLVPLYPVILSGNAEDEFKRRSSAVFLLRTFLGADVPITWLDFILTPLRRIHSIRWAVMAHAFNSTTREAEAN